MPYLREKVYDSMRQRGRPILGGGKANCERLLEGHVLDKACVILGLVKNVRHHYGIAIYFTKETTNPITLPLSLP